MLKAMEYSKSDYSEYINIKIQDGCQTSATIRHPLMMFRRICYYLRPGVSVICYVTTSSQLFPWESLHTLCTIQARGYPRVSTFNFIFIYTYFIGVFLKYELSTTFTIYSIYQCIFSLDIFISLSEASVLIT